MLERHDENLAVANQAGTGRRGDRLLGCAAQAIISMVTTNPAGEVVAQLPLEKPSLLVLDIPRRL
jgi:hypothetical protein